MLLESDLIPFTVTTPVGNKSIVLSPHPDDEALGCGGTIRLLLESKKQIKVVFLTSGDKADPSNKLSRITYNENPPIPPYKRDNPPFPPLLKGGGGGLLIKGGSEGDYKEGERGLPDDSHITEYALLRENEAVKALSVLGVSDYEFLRFPDRELDAYYEDVLERLLKIVETYIPDTIYSPSMIELNPDHRTTAALSLEIQRRMTDRDRENIKPIRLIFYEITTPLRPNMLIDITSVYNRKKQAIKKYKSQLKLMDYLRHITALNTIRSLTLNPAPRPCNRGFLWCGVNGPRYVEAFWCIDEPLSEEDITKWLSYQRANSEHL